MKRMLELDLRSLAAMRIATGALLAYDLFWRLWDLRQWYTDEGVLPRRLVVENYWNPVWWCVHLFSGSSAGSGALLLVQLLAALALAAGWHTRAASLLCWGLTLSLHNRNPLVLDHGDRLLLLLLFWGMLMPWEARYSLDSRRCPGLWSGGHRQVTAGGAGYLLLVVQMYLLAGYWKLDPVWYSERSALQRALLLEEFCKPAGRWLLGHPGLMEMLSLFTVVVEVLGPALLLLGNGRARLGAVMALMSLHLGIGLTMDLEFFPLVSLTVLIGLLPSLVWPGSDLEPETPPGPGLRAANRPALLGLAAAATALSLSWNALMVIHHRHLTWVRGSLTPLAQTVAALRFAQFWDLFAPVPRAVDCRYAVEARLSDGSTVDLLRSGQAFPVSRPADPYREFADQRQRNYLSALEFSVGTDIRHRYLRWLAVEWETAHPERRVLWLRLLCERSAVDPSQSTPRRHTVQIALATPREPIWLGPVAPLPAPEPVGEPPPPEDSP